MSVRVGSLAVLMLLGAAPVLAQDAAQVERGTEVFESWCGTCHGPGPRMPGTIALRAKYNGEIPAALAERTDLTPAGVRFFVRNGVSIMPFFRKTEVSDSDLEALIAYLARPRPEADTPESQNP